MKKLVLFLACSSLLASGAVAQEKLVDEVSKDISSYTPDYSAALKKLQPALTNDETKSLPQTWFVAGKAEFGLYDGMLGKKQLGQDVNRLDMGNALLSGYDYLLKALPLDSIVEVDKKTGAPKLDKTGRPKVKTKYSKDIVGLIIGHHNDFSQVGNDFYDAKDWKKAAKAWNVYASLPNATFLGKDKPAVPDTIIGQVRFFQGIAAWQGGESQEALDAFAQARKLGYTKKEAYDYALACASNLKNEAQIVAIAQEALPLYGAKDSQYVRILINNFINKKDYASANKMLDQAMVDNPTNAEFCNLKGILLENQDAGSMEKGLPFFKKAVEIDPEYAKGQFDLGRYYFNKAVKVVEENPNLTGAALAKQVNPLYEQALPYLEKAFKLDPSNNDAKNALRNIYYKLGNEEKLNAIEKQ